MKNLTILIISLVSLQSLGQEFSIGYTSKNSLVLKGDTCESLHNEYVKICDWKKSIDENFSVPPEERAKCRTLTNGKKQIIISKCLPKLVKSAQNKRHYKDGPNCWGTALHLKGISLAPRFVWSKEMNYWQESPLCNRLEVKNDLMPGDIINIYGPEYIFERDEYSKGDILFETLYPNRGNPATITSGYSGFHNFLHSETYISPKLSFGKESPNKDDRYLIKNINEVYGRSRDSECQENQSLIPNLRENDNQATNIRSGKCSGYFSNAYRCENFNSYFRKTIRNSYEEEVLIEIEKLKKLHLEISKLQLVSTFKLSQQRVTTLLAMADSNSEEALNELKTKPDKNLEMLLVLKYFTAHGIRKTLEQAYLTEATELL